MVQMRVSVTPASDPLGVFPLFFPLSLSSRPGSKPSRGAPTDGARKTAAVSLLDSFFKISFAPDIHTTDRATP